MLVHTDFPYGIAFDTMNRDAAKLWWDTQGAEWVRVNIITDALGHVIGSSGTSQDLSGGADRALLLALREISDVVVLGGATVRAEPLSVPRDKPLVVISRSANIPDSAIERARGGITVLHHSSAVVPEGVTGVALARFTAAAILKAIHALGHRRIVVEGGLTVINLFVAGGVITEWCQTVSPIPGEQSADVVAPTVSGELSLMAHDDSGFRYTRRLVDGAPTKARTTRT
ncbi:MAG: dihydrofolate reductase family protein [Microbacteriaceae bacterium]